jgi:hypothetical protein
MYHPQYGQAAPPLPKFPETVFKFKVAQPRKSDWIYERIQSWMGGFTPGETINITGRGGVDPRFPTVFHVVMRTQRDPQEIQKVFEVETGAQDFTFEVLPVIPETTEPPIVVPELVEDESEEERVFVPLPVVPSPPLVAKPAIPWVMLAVVGVAAFLIGRTR